MNKRGWVMLRVFINHFNPKAKDAFLHFLPNEKRQALLLEDIRSSDLHPLLQPPQKALEKVHYSWINDYVKTIPASLQVIAISSLSQEQIKGLGIYIPAKISLPVKTFVAQQIYNWLEMERFLPYGYLPQTEFSSLMSWKKNQIVNLVDFLGLHDLAQFVKHIVNRDHLKNIYTCLTPKQFYYLKVCLHQKDKIISPQLPINPATIDSKQLKQVLHKRGLIRLARALSGQSTDFVWHLSHYLDKGRGTILLNEFTIDTPLKITQVLKQQVINLMNFLKSE